MKPVKYFSYLKLLKYFSYLKLTASGIPIIPEIVHIAAITTAALVFLKNEFQEYFFFFAFVVKEKQLESFISNLIIRSV
jgi:hypothetical protein